MKQEIEACYSESPSEVAKGRSPSGWAANSKRPCARSDIEAFVEISGLLHLPDDFVVLSLFVGIRFLDSCEFLLQDVLDIGSHGNETTGTGVCLGSFQQICVKF